MLSQSPFVADSTLTIPSGCYLYAEPGVEIRMGNNAYLIVRGKLDFTGTESQPVHIHAKDSAWGIIYFDETGSVKSTLKYVIIEDATTGVYGTSHNDSVFQQAAVSCLGSLIELEHCYFKNNRNSFYCFYCHNSTLRNIVFDSTNAGEKIHGEQSHGTTVDSSVFYYTAGSGDAIDFDGSNNVLISNNWFFGGDGDAIDIGNSGDIGCNNITIAGNRIFGMGDKGISCGELSVNIFAHHNLVVGCDKGIASKQGSQVMADHNTLFSNRIGILSTDYLDNWGPGNITVTNSIIAASVDSTWAKYYTSALDISFSVSDVELMPGSGNLFGNPWFVFAAPDSTGNFYLDENSPAIDQGDPGFMLDADSTRTDIGAFFYDQSSAIKNIANNSGEVNAFPNPANTRLVIRLPKQQLPNGKWKISVYDLTGRCSQSQEIINPAMDQELTLGAMAPGIYMIKITVDHELVSYDKLVIH